ncbi:MAG: ATPase [Candidatus Taylorbacteria bacterium RIFCSPHIGHO2_02_FULL_44_12]|uniref:ATPase n=1 Tax=Candidatus Taylorbacteria bacterium RIFCSPHIGHO2_02_FULL_44_12 TaxID=1802308 RepID=A0A1G2MM71_9BACT|nr:MAG: ATPase [Candidatus Taylorbacteria bacterium RIFCSPHIGHO2_02_FULL_44_12]
MDTKSVIKRTILQDIRNHVNEKEITLIVGPRQAGKTTLMCILEEELRYEKRQTLFLSLDRGSDAKHFASQEALIEKLTLELGHAGGVVFIDEIQRKENAGLFLKGIYDMMLPYKFIVSGSGSIELKEKIHESLAGRKLVFAVYPVSLWEFINFCTAYRYEDTLAEFFAVEQEFALRLLDEYLRFGGYPRVILAETHEEKTRVMDEIFQSYVEKDISHLLRVEKLDAFRSLVEVLASQNGQLLTVTELSNTLSLSLETVRNYLWYLEHTFIMERVTPFFRNKRKEITKSPVLYFTDLGLRNYALGQYGASLTLQDVGFLFQNLIYHILKTALRYSGARIHFWRTKDQAEIDFVVTRGSIITPFEVKYTALKDIMASKSLRSFIKQYAPRQAFIVTRANHADSSIEETRVQTIPFYDLYQMKL